LYLEVVAEDDGDDEDNLETTLGVDGYGALAPLSICVVRQARTLPVLHEGSQRAVDLGGSGAA